MRNQLFVFAAILVVAGFVQAQPGPMPKPKTKPTRVALIDLGRFFKNYDGFKSERQKLQKQLAAQTELGKAKIAHLQALKNDYKLLPAGSAEARKLANAMVDAFNEYKASRKKQKQRFLNLESEIYKSTYAKIERQVSEIAARKGFTLVLRYNSEGVLETQDPKTIRSRLNRMVVLHDPSIDITDVVTAELNKKFQSGE